MTTTTLAASVATPSNLYKAACTPLRLASANDRATSETYSDMLEEMTLEHHEALSQIVGLKSRPCAEDVPIVEDHPTRSDIYNACALYKKAYDASSGSKKRRILFSAFFQYFNPKFYSSGRSKILWGYAEKLEYPDAVYLKTLVEQVRKQTKGRGPMTVYSVPHGSFMRDFKATERIVCHDEEDFEYARRLEAIKLARLSDKGSYHTVEPMLALAEQLMEFIWGLDETAETSNLT